jgi:hypothetical protein
MLPDHCYCEFCNFYTATEFWIFLFFRRGIEFTQTVAKFQVVSPSPDLDVGDIWHVFWGPATQHIHVNGGDYLC